MLKRLAVRKSAKSNGRRKESSAKKKRPNLAIEGTDKIEVATVTTIGTKREVVVITEITLKHRQESNLAVDHPSSLPQSLKTTTRLWKNLPTTRTKNRTAR